MTIKFLMNVGGFINANEGDIRNVTEETARMYIGYMIAEEFIPPPRPRRKPIIVHTRCIQKQK